MDMMRLLNDQLNNPNVLAQMGKSVGADTDQVKKNLAQETGLKKGQVTGLLTQLAPLLLGALGNQKKEENLDASGIASLLPSLGSLLGGASSSGGLAGITNILDADKDGNVVDDIKGFLGKIMK